MRGRRGLRPGPGHLLPFARHPGAAGFDHFVDDEGAVNQTALVSGSDALQGVVGGVDGQVGLARTLQVPEADALVRAGRQQEGGAVGAARLHRADAVVRHLRKVYI